MEVNLHFCLPAVRPQRDFSDLQRTDRYEDLKRQQTLKKIADLKLQWIARIEIDPSYSARLRETLAKERAAHKANYEALSSIISKILTAKEDILNTKS